GAFYDRQVRNDLEILFQVIDEPDIQEAVASYFQDNLYGRDMPCGVMHGDFSVTNIFAENDQVSGLIDWEFSTSNGIPLLDALYYLTSVHRLYDKGIMLPEVLSLLASDKWPVSEEQDFLFRQYT